MEVGVAPLVTVTVGVGVLYLAVGNASFEGISLVWNIAFACNQTFFSRM
jgi:hypothetical protein